MKRIVFAMDINIMPLKISVVKFLV